MRIILNHFTFLIFFVPISNNFQIFFEKIWFFVPYLLLFINHHSISLLFNVVALYLFAFFLLPSSCLHYLFLFAYFLHYSLFLIETCKQFMGAKRAGSKCLIQRIYCLNIVEWKPKQFDLSRLITKLEIFAKK